MSRGRFAQVGLLELLVVRRESSSLVAQFANQTAFGGMARQGSQSSDSESQDLREGQNLLQRPEIS